MLRTSLLVAVACAALSAADAPAPQMSGSSAGPQPSGTLDAGAIFASSFRQRLDRHGLELGTMATGDLEWVSDQLDGDPDAEPSLQAEQARSRGVRLADALAARRETAIDGRRFTRVHLAEAWDDVHAGETDADVPLTTFSGW